MNKFKLITYMDRQNHLSDVFIKHYLSIFEPEDFFFLLYNQNFEEMKEYLESFGFTQGNMHVISRKYFGFGENVHVQNMMKRVHLDKGYTVVYADVDELIWHPDLKNYISSSREVHFCASGYQIIQHPTEDFLNRTEPILDQRNWCQPDYNYYSKLCILKKDFTWTGGRHNKNHMKADPSLYLIDIGKVCKRLMLENNKESVRIYKTVMERYTVVTMEDIDNQYVNYLSSLAEIPQAIKDAHLF